MRKLIKIKDVLAHVPVSRAQLYVMMAEGKFPKQVKLGGYGAFWVEEEIDVWIQAHIDARANGNPCAAVTPERANPCTEFEPECESRAIA